jgi:sulfate/thiosulfate transport system ATP-binding protein
MSIDLRGIHKTFGTFVALDRIDLKVADGELVALLGLSGSGKTTLLRIIAGLEIPSGGTVQFFGRDARSLSVRDRKIGFVFQHYALFRHMTVFENVAFAMRVLPRASRPPEGVVREKVHELLRLVQLDFLADRYPSELSGGQRQRVALARTLAVQPRVLLLDEPFGALDARVRQELRQWLRRLHERLGLTCVFVTHDQDEALELADRVVVMNGGKIEQVGTPEDVYHRPANAFVASFLGNVNLFHGRIENGRVFLGDTSLEISSANAVSTNGSGKAAVYVRPHLLEIDRVPRGAHSFAATIRSMNPAGPQVRIELITEWGDPVNVDVDHQRFAELGLNLGSRVFLHPKENRVFIYQI